MPFQVITMKNKTFWSRVLTAMAGFAMVIAAMAVAFPLSDNVTTQSQTITTTTTTAEQEK